MDDLISYCYAVGSLCFLVGTVISWAHRHGVL